MPVVYASDIAKSLAFYTRFGLTERARSRSRSWIELSGGGCLLALHVSGAPAASSTLPQADEPVPAGQVMLSFVSDRPLEELVNRLAADGHHPVRGIADEGFGRSVVFVDPDGAQIQVNEHDEELYT